MHSFSNYYNFLWGFHDINVARNYARIYLKEARLIPCEQHRMFSLLKYRRCTKCGLKVYHEDRKTGSLVLLGTEFGNVYDISFRVLDALENAEYILCEHKDSFGFLMEDLGFKPKGEIFEYWDFDTTTEGDKKKRWLFEQINLGKDAVMLSDQGMPFIMDPGHHIFKDALDYGIKTTIFPGPDVPATALNISGLNTWDFVFLGSLSHQSEDKINIFKNIINDNKTHIFFDIDPYIFETLKILSEVLGEDKKIALCFNITRETENIVRGTVKEVLDWMWNNGYDKEREDAEWLVQLAVVVEGKNPQGPQI